MSLNSTSMLDSTIQVVARPRPLNNREKSMNATPCLTTNSPESQISLVKGTGKKGAKHVFQLNTVLNTFTSQLDVFKTIMIPVLKDVSSGLESTVFAYGQTGTGKTYTMEGDFSDEAHKGLIPRSLEYLFSTHENIKIHISFLEIYNEDLTDLLSDSKSHLKIMNGECIGLSKHPLHTIDDLSTLLKLASNRRQTAETKMNSRSSRSHCICSISIKILESITVSKHSTPKNLIKRGILHLVDLAGSECSSSSNRHTETGNINQSLLTLGRVITALKEKHSRIPYRDSKLTRLLENALGGSSKTRIVLTLSPSSVSAEESLSTLKFGSNAYGLKNRKLVQDVSVGVEGGMTGGKGGVSFREMELKAEYMESQMLEAQSELGTKHMEMKRMEEEFIRVREEKEKLEEEKEGLEEVCNKVKQENEKLEEEKKEIDLKIENVRDEVGIRSQKVSKDMRGFEFDAKADIKKMEGEVSKLSCLGVSESLETVLNLKDGMDETSKSVLSSFSVDTESNDQSLASQLKNMYGYMASNAASFSEHSRGFAAEVNSNASDFSSKMNMSFSAMSDTAREYHDDHNSHIESCRTVLKKQQKLSQTQTQNAVAFDSNFGKFIEEGKISHGEVDQNMKQGIEKLGEVKNDLESSVREIQTELHDYNVKYLEGFGHIRNAVINFGSDHESKTREVCDNLEKQKERSETWKKLSADSYSTLGSDLSGLKSSILLDRSTYITETDKLKQEESDLTSALFSNLSQNHTAQLSNLKSTQTELTNSLSKAQTSSQTAEHLKCKLSVLQSTLTQFVQTVSAEITSLQEAVTTLQADNADLSAHLHSAQDTTIETHNSVAETDKLIIQEQQHIASNLVQRENTRKSYLTKVAQTEIVIDQCKLGLDAQSVANTEFHALCLDSLTKTEDSINTTSNLSSSNVQSTCTSLDTLKSTVTITNQTVQSFVTHSASIDSDISQIKSSLNSTHAQITSQAEAIDNISRVQSKSQKHTLNLTSELQDTTSTLLSSTDNLVKTQTTFNTSVSERVKSMDACLDQYASGLKTRCATFEEEVELKEEEAKKQVEKAEAETEVECSRVVEAVKKCESQSAELVTYVEKRMNEMKNKSVERQTMIQELVLGVGVRMKSERVYFVKAVEEVNRICQSLIEHKDTENETTNTTTTRSQSFLHMKTRSKR